MAESEHTSADIYSAIFDEAETDDEAHKRRAPRNPAALLTEDADRNERFEDAYARWLELWPPKSNEKHLECQRVLLAMLEEHAADRARLPGEVAFELVMAFRDLERGIRRPILQESKVVEKTAEKPLLKRRIKQKDDADKVECILDGLRYIAAAKAHDIADERPRYTVAALFRVSYPQVGVWVREFRSIASKRASRQRKLSPKMIELIAEKSGKRFQKLRAAKNSP